MHKIAQYRKQAGLTQKQLAEAIGVPQQQVSCWETGSYKPSAETLLKISKVLKCTMEELI